MRLEELDGMPWREVEDYLLYIQLIVREEAAQQRRTSARR